MLRQVQRVILGEKANLKFLDLIRKQLDSVWGGHRGVLSNHSVCRGLWERGQHGVGGMLGNLILPKLKKKKKIMKQPLNGQNVSHTHSCLSLK